MSLNNTRQFNGISPKLEDTCYIDSSAIVVGDVQVGTHSSLWPYVVARGDVNFIRIGSRSNIQDASVLHVTRKSQTLPNGYPLYIGDDVTVGHKVMLHGCTLGDRILVGMGAIIMDGAVVQDDVMIAAGALVPPNKTLESGFLYVGSPVKQARPLTEEEKAFLAKSAQNYVELKSEYLA